MHKSISTIVSLLFCSAAVFSTISAANLKSRIVVLTDITPITVEPDDMESLIRLLVHADLFEIEALIATTGWSNDGGHEPYINLIHDVIDAYEKDLTNLLKRSGQTGHLVDENKQYIGYWPSPDYLRSRTVLGSAKRGFSFIGEGNNSAGSELIVTLADEEDERPLWVLVWGGGNTLAQSIWHLQQERTAEELKMFLNKIRTYTITDQDRGLQTGTPYDISSHQWMRREFERDLFFIWDECAWKFQNNTGKENWNEYATRIQNHGNLGSMYPKYIYGVEGDTPSFLYVWPNGLNDPENPEYGGWGGYFTWLLCADNQTYAYTNHKGETYTISEKYQSRFYPAIFNNFAARMGWVKNGTGNRNPVVIINGDSSFSMITVSPLQGASVTLDASATYDPDGDRLTFSWWLLPEAGTYKQEVAITDEDTSRAIVAVPSNSAKKSFHVICEVTDNGTPALTGYRRIIFTPTDQITEVSAPIRQRVPCFPKESQATVYNLAGRRIHTINSIPPTSLRLVIYRNTAGRMRPYLLQP